MVDRDAAALESIALPDVNEVPAEKIPADIESGPWPLDNRQFAGVVVTNYLWRPLFPRILASLAPGGVLLYETFARGNETVGKPSRPDFLLRTGELLDLCAGLRIVAYENGFIDAPGGMGAKFVQRIVAAREAQTSGTAESAPAMPARYSLGSPG